MLRWGASNLSGARRLTAEEAEAAAAAAGTEVVVVRTLFGSRVLVPRDADPLRAPARA